MINDGNNFFLIGDEWLIQLWGLDIKPFEVKSNEEIINFIKDNDFPINEVCEINGDDEIKLYKMCLLLISNMDKDARILLMEDLIKIGVKEVDAELIALDAGSSQTIVNKNYLNNFSIRNKIKEKILNKVCKFYVGEY